MSEPRGRTWRDRRSFFWRKRDASPPSAEDYERAARAEIDRFKNPEPSRLGSALDHVHRPIAKMADVALDNEIGAAVARAVEATMRVLDDRASWSVRAESIYQQFRSAGHEVCLPGDVHQLELYEVDAAVGGLAAKYTSMAAAEGAGARVLGLAGTAIDIPGVVALSLRAISEYAVYYGFDPSAEDEKAFVLMTLAALSAPTVEERERALVELTRMAVLLAGSDSRTQSRRLLGMQMVTKVAKMVGSRFMKVGVAEAVPILGAGIAAVFNAWFLRTLAEGSYELYRERFLIEKHGPEVVVPVRG